MSVRPITATDPACFGVCCSQHQRCARYAAVDGLTGGASPIATCDRGDGSRPLFLAIAATPSAPAASRAPTSETSA